MKLIYSQDALEDLTRLRAFIAKKNPAAASRIASELLARITQLCDFPEIGRPVRLAPDPSTVRDMVFGKYIIRYTLGEDLLIVLRVWHHREDR